MSRRNKYKWVTWTAIPLMAFGLYYALHTNLKQQKVMEQIQASKTPEQIKKEKREKQIKDQFSQWDGSHIKLTRMIKQRMNDPNSYEHVKTGYVDQGSYLLVVTSFRGTNSFGAKVLNEVTAKVSINGQTVEIKD